MKTWQVPKWRKIGQSQPDNPSTSTRNYHPKFNLAPENYSPVMVSGAHVSSDSSPEERMILPMKWGFIPSWHKKDPKQFQYKIINARTEGLTEKASFRNALSKGRRCVVLADGFFEWLSKGGSKVPFFVHAPQTHPVDFSQCEPDENLDSQETGGGPLWIGRKPIMMAGVFDVSVNSETGEELWSYAVITVPSSKKLEWLHDRMPALLDGDESISQWLDSEHVPLSNAMKCLHPCENVEFFQVGSAVNSVRNDTPECVIPVGQKISSPGKRSSNKTPDKNQTSLLDFFQPKNTKMEEDSKSSKKMKFELSGKVTLTPKDITKM